MTRGWEGGGRVLPATGDLLFQEQMQYVGNVLHKQTIILWQRFWATEFIIHKPYLNPFVDTLPKVYWAQEV